MTPEELALDAIGWFVKTPPDSEEQQLLDDIAIAITERDAEWREKRRKLHNCLLDVNCAE